MIKAVLFDLDGTLADTALDLGAALNRMRVAEGLSAIPMEQIRPIASHGAAGLLKLGFNIDKDHADFQQWRARYLAEYECCFTEQTVLFPAINQLIEALNQQGLKWGIITNKPKHFTDRLVPCLNFIVPPASLVSGDTTDEAKPSTKPMLFACDEIAVSPSDCLYVGDAKRDMQAGKNAGMKTVLVSWGYIGKDDDISTWPYDVAIDQPLEILKLI